MIWTHQSASRRRQILCGALAAALLGLAGAALLSRRRDLALGRPVSASSVRLGDPAGLVNGFVEYGGYALHTKSQGPAWVAIDLGQIHRLGEISLYPRGDGFLDEPGARIAVEVSRDGQAFRVVGACAALFSQLSPCVVDAGGAEGQHVRVSHRTLLVLSEIEVRAAE